MLRHVCLLLAASIGTVAAADPAPAGGPLALLRQLDEGFVAVFEKVAPCVVVIEATKRKEAQDPDLDFLPGEKESRSEPGERTWTLPSRSEGSGFIIRADGYVLTNHHVVADAEKIVVRLRDSRSFPAKVLGVDDKTDIAVLRVEATDLPTAEIGDSNAVRVGQLVCAIGAPFNQHFSFSVGWVSGKGRTNLLSPGSDRIFYEDYIQTDTFINPGNSGGPLFDVEGRVIGMNTLINGIGRGLAFAIPSSMFQEVAQQLISHGRIQRSWLGIRMDALSERPALREHAGNLERGVVIETIEPDSPAYRSQLRAADVIVEIDGTKVSAPLEVQKEILRKKIGSTVQLTVWRAGTMMRLPVVLAEQPAQLARPAQIHPVTPEFEGKADTLGMTLRDAHPSGAEVVMLRPGSAAHKAGVAKADLITRIGSKEVRNAATAAAVIGDLIRADGDKEILLQLTRRGERTFKMVKPE